MQMVKNSRWKDTTGLWKADFYNRYTQRCGNNIRIPKSPKDFNIAYTAFGTEEPPPLKVDLSGPGELNTGEQGTWTASVSGGSGSTTYDWEYRLPGTTTWRDKSCTGSSCSHTFYSDTRQSAHIRVTVTKDSESDVASHIVYVNPDCDGRICINANGKSVAVQNPEVTQTTGQAARLQWATNRTPSVPEFVVEHRADTTGAWSELGTVAPSDSVRSDSTAGTAYRFEAEDLDVGTHQFRLAVEPEGQSKDARLTSEAVTARLELEDAYRLRAYPNPVREQATVELAVEERQDVRMAVYDVLGRQVGTLHDGPLPAQETERVSLNASQLGLSSGTYFVRVQGERFTATQRLTVVQ